MTDKPIRRKRKTPRMDVARRVPTRYQVMMDAIEDGTFTLDMLDDEEILRGRLRTSAGDFRGRPPAVIPHALAVELVRRQRAMIMEQIGPLTDEALKAQMSMIKNGTTVHDGPRSQMIKLALEYGLGKPTEKVEVHVEQKVEHYGNIVLDSTVPLEAEVEEEL